MTIKNKGFVVKGCGKGRADWVMYTELCKGCGLCIVKCPINVKGQNCLKWSKEVGIYSTPVVEPDSELCIACRTCERLCPDSAIRIEQVKK